jgi:hypothetical protein
MANGILLATVFNDSLASVLRLFNVRFIEQLASIVATFEGKFALASLLDISVNTEEFRSILRTIDEVLSQEHGLSLSAPHQVSGATGYAVMAQRYHGLGYTIPELEVIQFGDPLPNLPGAGMGSAGMAPGGSAAPPTATNHMCVVTPVRNQFYRGTCMAFAAIALLESKILRETGPQNIDLSEQYLFYRARQLDPNKTEKGTRPQYVYNALSQYGTCEEMLWPYIIELFRNKR